MWTQGLLGKGVLRREKILMVELVMRRRLCWAKAGSKKYVILSGQIYEGTALVHRRAAVWEPVVLGSEYQTRV